MDGKGKVVCVTGASGFIASWLVKLLLARGYTVHAVVRSLVPTTSAYARGRTPNFQKLKFAAGSDEADDCLHAAFSQDYTENDQLLMVLGEQRDQLSAKVKWLEDLVEEGEGFLSLHEEGHIGLDRLKETLKRERKVLAGLTKAMDLARKGREEKKINLFWFG